MNNTSCSESTIHSSFQNKIKSESTESLLLVSQNHFFLSCKVRVFIFITFLFLSIIVDIDNGIISSSSLKIKKDLCLSDSNYGLFASIPFTGRIFGLIIFMSLISQNHRQLILVITIIFQGASFFVYLFSNNIYILLGTRTFTAIMKTFTSIYMPVWIDQFGIRQYKTILFTLVYMTNPYGQVIGFAIGTVLFPNDWIFSLFCIGCILKIFGLLFFIFPNKYFSSKYMFIGYGENEHKREKLVATKQMRTSVFGHYSKLQNSLKNKISNSPQKQYMNSNVSHPKQQTQSIFTLLLSPFLCLHL